MVKIQNVVFRVVTPYSLVGEYHNFGGISIFKVEVSRSGFNKGCHSDLWKWERPTLAEASRSSEQRMWEKHPFPGSWY
jgi:hypothetical protein